MTEEFAGRVFRIVSVRDADGNVRCTLIFKGAAQQHSLELPGKFFPWSPLWYVSPDAHWILRVQKTGSGSNCGIVYQIGPGQKVLPQKSLVSDLAFATWQRESKPPCINLFHEGMIFERWEQARHGFRFVWRASHWPWCEKKHLPMTNKGVKVLCFYDLRTQQVSLLEGTH